jgi:hypothetical protein
MNTIYDLTTIVPELKRDLEELVKTGQMNEAMKLTKEFSAIIGKPIYFAHFGSPHFPTRNFEAPTVFVHLNPGASVGDTSNFDTFFSQKWNKVDFYNQHRLKNNSTIEEIIEKYAYDWEWYARNRFDRDNQRDNFDFKQACFLKGFPDNGIDLKDGHDYEIQKNNSINVIDQKLQLELFPYSSNSIDTSLLNVIIRKKPELIIPYINRLLDLITIYPHKYILFGSRIYDTLFKFYDNNIERIIEYISPEQRFEGITKNALTFSFIRLKWKNKIIDAGIANSFPRRDLPNAYAKMEMYGKLCADYYISEQLKLNK